MKGLLLIVLAIVAIVFCIPADCFAGGGLFGRRNVQRIVVRQQVVRQRVVVQKVVAQPVVVQPFVVQPLYAAPVVQQLNAGCHSQAVQLNAGHGCQAFFAH